MVSSYFFSRKFSSSMRSISPIVIGFLIIIITLITNIDRYRTSIYGNIKINKKQKWWSSRLSILSVSADSFLHTRPISPIVLYYLLNNNTRKIMNIRRYWTPLDRNTKINWKEKWRSAYFFIRNAFMQTSLRILFFLHMRPRSTR